MYGHAQLTRAVARYFLVVLLTAFIGVLSLAADLRTNTARTCVQCHTMRPQYYTWKSSSHAEAADCLSCHLSPGLAGAWQMARDMGRMVQRQISGTYQYPVMMLTYLDDASCRKCHLLPRQVSAAGDFLIPHLPHDDVLIRCTACHNTIVHGGASFRSEIRETPPYLWDAQLARRVLGEARLEPLKESCMGCHYLRRVSNTCNVCHSGNMVPADHLREDFTLTHGAKARADLEGCNTCHGMAGTRKITLRQFPATEQYVRINNFCRDCHAKRPASHGEGRWRGHGRAALADQRRCLACHDNQAGLGLPAVATTTCATCHPSNHEPGWQQRHSLPPDPWVNDNCWTCHSRGACQRCHVFWEQES